MNGRFRLLALGLVAGWGLLLEITLAFDTGHHWELTAQVMQEMGFNEPSRQTACVSNWMVDYYSSSPTASKRMREELSKLHCDNLYTAESARRHLARLTANARLALTSQVNDRELLLLLGATLHAVQDMYSHSNWPELVSTPEVLSNRTCFSAGEWIPGAWLSGSYDPRPYLLSPLPSHHPEHGSYDQGVNKDAHDRPLWPQAYFLAYCATREFVEALRSWIPAARWERLKHYQPSVVERLALNSEVKSAYGISLWINAAGQHGHWKGGMSGHNLMFLSSALSFVKLTSPNALWYRVAKGYRPLTRGLYTEDSLPPPKAPIVPGLDIQRTVMMLRIARVQEAPGRLGKCRWGSPDYYLTGGVHYGRPPLKKQELLTPYLHPKCEPESPFLGVPAVVFRDRVIQGARSFDNPWQAMVILDSAELARTGGELTFFLGVGEEDPGPDGTMDISPDRSRKGRIFQYQLKGSSITLPGTGQTFPAGEGKTITVRGDHRKSLEISFEIFPMKTR